MILVDHDIRKIADSIFDPVPSPRDIQPCSVDLHLADDVQVFEKFSIPWRIWEAISGVRKRKTMKQRLITRDFGGEMPVFPGESLLARTIERVTLPADVLGFVHGKSSIARGFLQVECAGLVDPGFSGTITLELSNLGPEVFWLRHNMRICQMTLWKLHQSVDRPYGSTELGSRYQGQRWTQPALPEK